MEKERLESLLIDYIDNTLDAEGRKTVERELTENADARQLYHQLRIVLGALDNVPRLETPTTLQKDFHETLRSMNAKTGRQVFFTPTVFRAAAAVILVTVGAGIGYWITKNQQQRSEIAALREEMQNTKRAMMAMLENPTSASSRMRAATVAYNMDKPDDQIVNALIKTMNEDPNTNVRLAALEALGKFHQQEHVRSALIASLATQKDPNVQIALIQLMVTIKEKSAVKELENITNDITTMKAVKDEAYSGIMKLS